MMNKCITLTQQIQPVTTFFSIDQYELVKAALVIVMIMIVVKIITTIAVLIILEHRKQSENLLTRAFGKMLDLYTNCRRKDNYSENSISIHERDNPEHTR